MPYGAVRARLDHSLSAVGLDANRALEEPIDRLGPSNQTKTEQEQSQPHDADRPREGAPVKAPVIETRND